MGKYTLEDINPYIVFSSMVNRDNCPLTGTPYEKRIVKWYELELVTWGEGYITTDGVKLPAERGSLFFRRPGMQVQGFAPYHCYLIIFHPVFDRNRLQDYNDTQVFNSEGQTVSPEGITGLKEDLYGLDLPPMINVSGTDRYLELFKPSYEVFLSGKNNRQFALKSYVLQILRMIFEEASLDGSAGRRTRSLTTNYPKIQKVKALIESSPDSRLTLEQLASVAELSPNFLCRIFREIEGEPPVTYINRCRINQAKKLLVETGKPVKEICYLCGFENSSYFFEVFRRFEGTTPLAFRYRHRIFSQQSPEGRQS